MRCHCRGQSDRRHAHCPGATGESDAPVSASLSEIRVQFRCALQSNVAVGLCLEYLFLEMRPRDMTQKTVRYEGAYVGFGWDSA